MVHADTRQARYAHIGWCETKSCGIEFDRLRYRGMALAMTLIVSRLGGTPQLNVKQEARPLGGGRFKNFERVARRKLLQLRAATVLDSLLIPPGNHLEALKDDRKGQHSIRINDQWRVCFVWKLDGAHQVEIEDYHYEQKMTKLLDETHPGEVLLEDFMRPMGITGRQLAADIDVSPSRTSDLVSGGRPITVDTALRLGLFFGMESRFWLNLQSEYDIRMAERETKAAIARRIRVFRPVAA